MNVSQGATGNRRYRLRLGIGTLLALGFAGLLAAVVALMTIVGLLREQRLFRQMRMEQAEMMVNTLSDVIGDALYFRDAEQLRHIAAVMRSQPQVRQLEIFDSEGNLLVNASGEKFPSGQMGQLHLLPQLATGESSVTESADALQLHAPIVAGGQLLGGVCVLFDKSTPAAFTRALILDHLWQSLLVSLIAIALSAMLARHLTHPIRRLLGASRQIAEGDLEIDADSDRGDELGELARAFEDMASSLQAAEAEEKDRRRELELLNTSLREQVVQRRRAQRETEAVNERLSQTLAELQQAQAARLQAERLRVMGQMASGVAHDINNTLQVVLAGTEELALDLDDAPSGVRATLTDIATAARDGSEVVRRLGQLYKVAPQSSDVTFEVSEVLHDVARLSAARWRDEARGSGQEIDLEVVAERCTTACSPSEFREALLNLVFNAVDAMPEGGKIELRAKGDALGTIVEVSDNGCGMDAKMRTRCTEPFVTSKGPRGSGLGLASVESFVKSTGGSLTVDSELGVGTTIRLHLPAAPAEAGAKGPAATADQPPLKILLADDERPIRAMIGRLLRVQGHEVVGVATAEAALEEFAERRFDLLVTDRAMPGMNGDQLAAAIKALRADLPVLMVTGFGALMEAEGECPPEVDMVLGKPVTRADLQHAISRLIPPSTPSGQGGRDEGVLNSFVATA